MSDPMPSKRAKYQALIARGQALTPEPLTAVAHPCDESSLRGAVEAAEQAILAPILVGPSAKIRALAAQFELDISGLEIVDAPHSHASADAAVQLVREGKAELLMKGSLHTDELMGAVVRSATGLRTERRISHAFVMDVPALDRVIIITDAAINIFPTLEDKLHIVQNAIDLAVALNFPAPQEPPEGCHPVRGGDRQPQDPVHHRRGGPGVSKRVLYMIRKPIV